MSDSYKLIGKVAVVTGGASGIGKGAALEMAKLGADIGLIGRTLDELLTAQEEISAMSVKCKAYVADVAKPNQIRDAIDQAANDFSGLDVVFANAGINGLWASIDLIDEKAYDETMDINLKGTFFTIRSAVPHLQKRGAGSIVVCSSVNGNRMFSNTGATVYAASKAGQVAMAKMLAVELGRHGIRVNAICPGAIKTEIGDNTENRAKDIGQPVEYPEGPIPLSGRHSGSPEQVGKLVAFLASDASDHLNGEVIFIDGGQSLVQG